MPEIASIPPLTKLSEEEELLRDTVRDFAERDIRPRVAAMEQAGAIDPALLAKCFELGLMGIEIPEQHGGAGGSLFMTVLAVEELSAVDASTAIFVDVQNTLVNALLLKWASDDLKRRYLPRLATDCVGAYALSEPASGSDAFGLQTKATRQGDRWILDGRKLWITNGAEAGLFVIFANADFARGYKGITAFVVERGCKGFAVGKREDKLGIRASSTCQRILDGVEVPAANRVGDVTRRGAVRGIRLHEGVPGREVLPRCEDRRDLRGDEQHAVEHHRETDIEISSATYKGVHHAASQSSGSGPDGARAAGGGTGEGPEEVRGHDRSGVGGDEGRAGEAGLRSRAGGE